MIEELNNFRNWLQSQNKLKKKSIDNYVGGLKKIETDIAEENIHEETIYEINSIDELEYIKTKYFSVNAFKKQNERGNDMYKRSFKYYIEYKKSNTSENAGETSGRINVGKNAHRFVKCRLGQKKFRDELLKKWDYKCPITGIDDTSILISSHILPWSESNEKEKVDPNNGILLSPLFDALFDKNIISFKDDGTMIFSSKISEENKNRLNLKSGKRIKITQEMLPYLKIHRNKLK